MITIDAAYDRCEEITRAEAKNFSYGIRLLTVEKRQAMSALYAFARRVDDIGDGAAPPSEKLRALSDVRDQIKAVSAGSPPNDDAVLVALSHAMERYDIPPEGLLELVAGCEMDCEIARYVSFDQLVGYCRNVAGSIGRCSLAIFGSEDLDAPELAYTLGVALQLTNILRDIVEDRDVMGRVYLPQEDIERFGANHDLSGPPEALVDLVRFEAARARARYEEGLHLLDSLDRRSRSCVSAMAGIYRRLLTRIEANPLAVFERRVSIASWEKAWVAARSLAGAGV
jgi:phytoene synthase